MFEANLRHFPNISLAEADYDHSTINLVTYLLAIHIPFILFSNILVMTVIRLVRKCHTPHNAILFALAVVDFMCGVKLIVQIIDVDSRMFRETHPGCLFKHAFPVFWDNSSLNVLMLMCMERSVAINAPFWYKAHVRIRSIVRAVAVVMVLECLFSVVAFCVVYDYNIDESDICKRCDYWNNSPSWYVEYAAFIKLWTQLAVSLTLSGQVAYVALKKFNERHQRMKDLVSYDQTEWGPRESKRQRNDVRTTVSLMFLFIVLWLPTLVTPAVYNTQSVGDSQLYFRCSQHFLSLNSYINAIMYVFLKPFFKKAYWFLLTTRPTEWKELNIYVELTETEYQTRTRTKTISPTKSHQITENFTSQAVLSTMVTGDKLNMDLKTQSLNTSSTARLSSNKNTRSVTTTTTTTKMSKIITS